MDNIIDNFLNELDIYKTELLNRAEECAENVKDMYNEKLTDALLNIEHLCL